jgi:hypothetical protein
VGCSAARRPTHGGAGSRHCGGKQAVALGFGVRPRGGGMRAQGSGILFIGRRASSPCGPRRGWRGKHGDSAARAMRRGRGRS